MKKNLFYVLAENFILSIGQKNRFYDSVKKRSQFYDFGGKTRILVLMKSDSFDF